MPKCPDAVLRLVDRFNQQADRIRSPDYNEATLRIDFVNPMFHQLGWDIDNRQGYAEQYREVVHEDRVRVAGQNRPITMRRSVFLLLTTRMWPLLL